MSGEDVIVQALVESRKRRGMSQRDVVRLLGCSSSTVWNWERGRKSPTLNHLRVWAGVLGFDLLLTPATETRESAGEDKS